tara:strand:- start:1321 stop:1779 length:459 start_codon:yes stop_codon:yes gene_type:complete
MAGYIGTVPAPQATQIRQTFTATASQTTFGTAGYTVGFCDIYMNGVRLISGTDFVASNGSEIVLTTGAAAGDIIDFIAFTADDTASNMGGGKFKGDRGTFGSGGADIFRVHEQELNTDVTIDATENALASGPLTVASGVTLTVTTGGNLSIV